ncbi:uncharacterized protein LOC142642897 isoform X2 [Castanea sativa]|uniref:uncharacterized protein LOC142642897 isoform X2 n=1 Tax=Castanea sativa TaxID=21020 RepID=UPI003F64B352
MIPRAVETSGNVAQEERETYDNWTEVSEYLYLMFYQAAKQGDWQLAMHVLCIFPEDIGRSITESRETVLHIAFASKQMDFIKEVVRILTEQDFEKTNADGDTALCFAAKLGIVTIAKELVARNNRLPLIRNSEGRTPLCIAVLFAHREMALYLCSVTSFEHLSPNEYTEILMATITYDMYDTALYILKINEKSGTARYRENHAALREVARKPFAFGSKNRLSLWKGSLNLWFKGIGNKTSMQALVQELVSCVSEAFVPFKSRPFSYICVRILLFDAAKFGNVEFLIILIRSYPNIIWITNDFHQSLFHIAVINRQQSVFNLIYEIGAVKEIILTYVDSYKQNILHLAGKLAPPSRLNLVPGAALQMQQELLWFKKVEKIMPPSYLNQKNRKGQTPGDIFTEEHQHLQREGKEWMKDTANYCLIVATLITTVVFAAAFTVPGGSNQETGTPIFLKNKWFRVFFISDAVALVFSSSSILIFLSILTSRFTEMNFLKSLPLKLVSGLTALFISIVAMLVAFSATCFLVFESEMAWLPFVIIVLVCVPIILFVLLHFKLWADIIRSIW